jgi:TRAP-type mannitol/chloroaromatic compound transport system permease small subunit
VALIRRVAGRIDALNDGLGTLLRWLVLLMVLLGAGNALLRWSSRQLGLALNLTPLVEAQWYLFSAVFLLGAAYALRHDVHVRVDVLFERLGARARAWIDLVGTLALLVPFVSMMLWVSVPSVRASWRVREASPDPGGLPRYPLKALLLVCFALLLLQALAQIIRHFDVIRGRATRPPAAPSEPEARV